MTEAWPIQQAMDIENGEIPPGRYKCNFMSMRIVQVEDRDFATQKPTGKMVPKIVFDFHPVQMETKVVDGKKVRYSISRFFKPSNSQKSALYKFLSSMTQSGVMSEEIRKDPKAYQKLAEDMLGKGFLVTAAIPPKGTRTRAESIVPDPSVPFRDPYTTGFEGFPDAGDKEEDNDKFCYSLGNETNEAKKEQALSVLKGHKAYEAKKDYWVVREKIKELESYLVPMSFEGDDIPF